MFNRISLTAIAAILTLGAATIAADADSCSGRNHNTGTVVGAVGGGLIGNAITHGSAVGVVGGAVAGGLAGNAISRSSDCRHGSRYRQADGRSYYYDRYHQRHYYYRRD